MRITGGASGVYVLADDGAVDWLPAMLESLRLFNPALPVWCIPFSDRLDVIGRLADRYAVQILADPSLARLDEIGTRFVRPDRPDAGMPHLFRKFAVFWGPLDEFLYLDSDHLVLAPLDRLIDLPGRIGYDLLYALANLDAVYVPGALRDRMVREYRTHGFNTGGFAARRGLLDLAAVARAADAAMPYRMDFRYPGEQPFVNFCLDRRRLRMHYLQNGSGGTVSCLWAGWCDGLCVDGAAGTGLRAYDRDGVAVALIHWAGLELSGDMPLAGLHHQFVRLAGARLTV